MWIGPDQKSLPGYGMTCARMDLDHASRSVPSTGWRPLYEGASPSSVPSRTACRVVGVAKSGRGKNAAHHLGARLHRRRRRGGPPDWPPASAPQEDEPPRWRPRAPTSTAPRGDEEWMESHLELWERHPAPSGPKRPATAGSSSMGDGIVNGRPRPVAWARAAGATNLPYCEVFKTDREPAPEEWGFTPKIVIIGQLRSAARPMSFNRASLHPPRPVGDAGSMVSLQR